jgi:tetrahydromethanopterin S-methyltransferase subunit F
MHANDNDNGTNGNAMRGIAIGIVVSSLLWLLIVGSVMLWYRWSG